MTATGPEASPDAKVAGGRLVPLTGAVSLCGAIVCGFGHNWPAMLANVVAALLALQLWAEREARA